MTTPRPVDWQRIILQESETCYWLDPDGNRHEATDEENAEVRRQLLAMRERGQDLLARQRKP